MEYRVTDSRGVALPPSPGAGEDPAAAARVAACFREACASGGDGGERGDSESGEIDQFQHLLVRMANQ